MRWACASPPGSPFSLPDLPLPLPFYTSRARRSGGARIPLPDSGSKVLVFLSLATSNGVQFPGLRPGTCALPAGEGLAARAGFRAVPQPNGSVLSHISNSRYGAPNLVLGPPTDLGHPPMMHWPFIHAENTPTEKFGQRGASIPGPQLLGTGGTLSMGRKI
jgi:hypothetical protein